jgi:hypothetical protein
MYSFHLASYTSQQWVLHLHGLYTHKQQNPYD